MAERVETHAVILSKSLTANKVDDDVLPLSHFAVLRRNEIIASSGDASKPFVRGGGDGKEVTNSKSSGKSGGAGFKGDVKKGKKSSSNVSAKSGESGGKPRGKG